MRNSSESYDSWFSKNNFTLTFLKSAGPKLFLKIGESYNMTRESRCAHNTYSHSQNPVRPIFVKLSVKQSHVEFLINGSFHQLLYDFVFSIIANVFCLLAKYLLFRMASRCINIRTFDKNTAYEPPTIQSYGILQDCRLCSAFSRDRHPKGTLVPWVHSMCNNVHILDSSGLWQQ